MNPNFEDLFEDGIFAEFDNVYCCQSLHSVHGSQDSSKARWTKWCEVEDIFLTGIVMNIYYARHSLKPTNEEKLAAQDNAISSRKIVWEIIFRKYEVARRRHARLTGKMLPYRSLTALEKRWKLQGSNERHNSLLHRIGDADENEYYPKTKEREVKWETIFNRDRILSCSEFNFEKKMMILTSNDSLHEPPVSKKQRLH